MMHKNLASNTSLNPQNKVNASIIGARGYSGLELTRLLLNHSSVELTHCYATKDFSLTDDVLDSGVQSIVCLSEDKLMNHLTDVVFLATPAEVSLKLAPQIMAAGKKVIDLSGAFRLKKNDYNKWYNFDHTESEILADADYGLMPFAGPTAEKNQIISNPGCYATAITMALIPLLKRNLLETENIVIDAKSGTTGAGRKASENLLFSEVGENCLPYKVGQHQHLPEIQEAIEAFAGVQIEPHFSTHLLPVKRGLIAGIYATAKTSDLDVIKNAYAEEYANYDLVRFGRELPKLASLTKVVGTPYTHISFQLVGKKLYVFSAIDNLLKGAASQAVENLNRFLDLPLHHSLTISPMFSPSLHQTSLEK